MPRPGEKVSPTPNLRAPADPLADARRMRWQIAALACLPQLLACDTEPPPNIRPTSEASQTGDHVRARANAAPQTQNADVNAGSPSPAEAAAEIEDGDHPGRDRFAPIAGDPPHIDGYDPEEEGCPSGNWCGTIATASAIASTNAATHEQSGCPAAIVGSQRDKGEAGRAYEGLSPSKVMQGNIDRHGTARTRGEGNEDACCYHWFEYCSGRPLRDGDSIRTAPVRSDPDWGRWTELRERSPAEAGPELAEVLGRGWLGDAQAEHASIAAFARVALELMAVGAPADLIADTHKAAVDEVEHARVCLGLASDYLGQPLGPGPLHDVQPRTRTVIEIAVDAFVEGCVGETTAALMAERAAGSSRDESIAEALATISHDEARHAALAWRTLEWALRIDRTAVAAAVRRAAAQLRQALPDPRHRPCDPRLAEFGRLDERAQAHAARDAWHAIIEPMVTTMLGPST
jgi:hypothetical protein